MLVLGLGLVLRFFPMSEDAYVKVPFKPRALSVRSLTFLEVMMG